MKDSVRKELHAVIDKALTLIDRTPENSYWGNETIRIEPIGWNNEGIVDIKVRITIDIRDLA